MKKLLSSLTGILLGCSVLAAPGDTTVVVSHNATQLKWYQGYDTTVTFPDGSLSYRKIVMEFNIGKYACDGYNANNPGDGPGQTGWCADWDYDVHALAMTAAGDTFELGRLITPYANNNNPSTPASWNQSYYFDVTDYYSILKDDVTIRIFYAGWSGGFTGTIKFHMIEGPRYRDVLAIKPLWRGSFDYGKAYAPINTLIEADTINVPTGTVAAETKLIITGHGNSTSGCAEFCRRYYNVAINGSNQSDVFIWRDDCSANFLYPQSGTWIFDRGNWCPGDQVKTNIHQVPESTLALGSFEYDLNFQNYTTTDTANGYPQYKISSAMFFYGASNFTTDIGIEKIISPNNAKYYNRENPVFKESKIVIKNFGSSDVTSIVFEYGINGTYTENYTWSGTIIPGEEKDVMLPLNSLIADLNGEHIFNVKVVSVNTVVDDDLLNNELSATFDAIPEWDGGMFEFVVKVPGLYQNFGNQPVKYTIYNAAGNEVFSKSSSTPGETLTDAVNLVNGSYKLVVETSFKSGLSFFNYFDRGSFQVFNITNGRNRISIPKIDLGNGTSAGNFGSGIVQNFRVVNSNVSVEEANIMNSCSIYPNPAKNSVFVEWKHNDKATVMIYNSVGQLMFEKNNIENGIRIKTSSWATGLYYVTIQLGNHHVTKKLMID